MNEHDVAVRDALQAMRIPDHGPDFWDAVAGQLDGFESRQASSRARRAAVSHREVSAAIPTAAPVEPASPRQLAVDRRRIVIAADGQVEQSGLHPGIAAAAAAAAAAPVNPKAPLAPVVPGRFGATPRSADPWQPGEWRGQERRDRPTNGRGTRSGDRHMRVERDLALVPQAMRQQRSNIAVAMVAVAAVVVVAFAGSTLLRQRNDIDTRNEALKAENTAFSTEALVASGNDPAARAVLAWVGELGGGDADAAWEGLGPDSHEELGGRASFDEQFASLAAGYGAWATTSADVVLVTPVTASDEGTITIITLIGTVDGDPRADAFPVRIVGGIAKVEAFGNAGRIGLETPDASQGSEVRVGDELSVLVPADVTPVVRLDQGPTQRCGDTPDTTLESVGDGGEQRCTYAPTGMEAGGRVLTIGFTSPDGSEISARSVRFKAA